MVFALVAFLVIQYKALKELKALAPTRKNHLVASPFLEPWLDSPQKECCCLCANCSVSVK